MRNLTQLCGVPIDRMTPDSLLERFERFVTDGEQHIVLYANADCVNRAACDPIYARILQAADLVCADGMGVVWASTVTGAPLPERVNIGDVLEPFCRLAVEKGYRIFLLGGAPGLARRAAVRLKQQHPTLQIVGTHHGYFSSHEDRDVVALIKRTHPQVVLVGMGVPKQEKWIWRYRRKLQVPVLWGVGALFSYYAGIVPRAPVWMRRVGLEWGFRLFIEPKRLWRRYLIGNLVFITRTLSLLLADAALVIAGWLGAYAIRRQLNDLFGFDINPVGPYLAAMPCLVGVWLAICAGLGLYRRSSTMSVLQELRQVAAATCLGLLGTITLAFFLKELDVGRSVVLLAGGLMFGMLTFSRLACRMMERRLGRQRLGARRALIIGQDALAQRVQDELENWPINYDVVGFVADGALQTAPSDHVIGGLPALRQLVRDHAIHDVFVASTRLSLHEGMNLLAELEHLPVSFHVVSAELEPVCERLAIRRIGEVPLFDLPPPTCKRGYECTKRVLDMLVATIGLLACLPLLGFIALIIRLELRGPALFTQLRIGKDGRPFRMYKFRTMFADAPAYEEAPNDLTDPRVTRFGRVLRRWSLDELPQLLNVLRGEMSLVGPRPEMPFLVRRYEPWQRRRLSVKPGLTGLWQIVGRKELPLHQHTEYDLYYVRHRGWPLDATILARTVPAVLLRRGAF